jgi:hypothetical protein
VIKRAEPKPYFFVLSNQCGRVKTNLHSLNLLSFVQSV